MSVQTPILPNCVDQIKRCNTLYGFRKYQLGIQVDDYVCMCMTVFPRSSDVNCIYASGSSASQRFEISNQRNQSYFHSKSCLATNRTCGNNISYLFIRNVVSRIFFVKTSAGSAYSHMSNSGILNRAQALLSSLDICRFFGSWLSR